MDRLALSFYLALVLATLVSDSHARDLSLSEFKFDFEFNPIRLNHPADSNAMNSCLAWRLGVETFNIRNWSVVFKPCINYIRNYMLNGQYAMDVEFSVTPAEVYVNKNNATSDKDVWVFDLDETLLSDLHYYARPDVNFGGKPYNRDNFNEWIAEGNLAVIGPVHRLYQATLAAGYKIVIASGTPAKYRDARIRNLKNAGYDNWTFLILREEEQRGIPAVLYKSSIRTQLAKQGYNIVGSVGDQWSDLIGANFALQNVKVPNPMYYVS